MILRVLSLLIFFIFCTKSGFSAADNCTSTGNGNFNDGAIWSCGHQPDKDDNVTINHDVVLNVSFTGGGKISGNWNIGAGFSLIGAGFSLEFGSTTSSINGTLSINNLVINNGGVVTFGATSDVSVAGDFTNNNNSDDVTVNTANFQVAGDLNNGSGSGSTITGTGNIDVAGTVNNDGAGTIFTCTGAACCAGGCVLSVELVYFTVIEDRGEHLLKWKTASEINNDYFIVERSINGIDFTEIGFVNAAGNTSELSYYQFRAPANSGYSFYRISDVDFNKVRTFHNIVSIFHSEENISALIKENVLHVAFLDNDLKITLNIFNSSGQLVGNNYFVGESSPIELNLSSLKSGLYIVEILNGLNSKMYLKFIK